jgi:hypothetical protein
MRLSLHALAFAAAMLAGSLLGLPAQAAIITFVSQCTDNCANIGLADGDGVSATFTVNDAAIAPNAVLDNADVTAFTVDFGTIDIDLASQHGFLLQATLNAAGDGIASFTFGASEAAFGEADAETVVIQTLLDLWVASEIGSCATLTCSLFFLNGALTEGEPVVLLLSVAEVPEPSAALLLGTALLGLARTHGRRRP